MKRLLLLMLSVSMLLCIALLFGSCTDENVNSEAITIRFDTCGGDIIEGDAQVKIDKDGKLRENLIPVVEKNGYKLICWAYESDGTGKWLVGDIFTKDTTLYAVWEEAEAVPPESSKPDTSMPDDEIEATVTVTFDLCGGVLTSGKTEATLEKGTALKGNMIPECLRADYNFNYWAYDINGEYEWYSTDVFNEDTTLYAIWKYAPNVPAIKYVTIHFSPRGGEISDGYDEVEIKVGDTLSVEMLPLVKKDGYTFLCWAYDRAGNDKWSDLDTFNEDTVLYAVWKEETTPDEPEIPVETVTVTFNAGKGYFENSADYETEIVKDGRLTKLPTPVIDEAGWVFTGWYKDEACTELASLSNKYSQDTTLYAGWEKNEPCTDGTYDHLFGSWEEEKRADCTNAGVYARYCLYCQYKQTKISEPAKGHQVTSWQEHFMTKVGVCTRIGCGEIIRVSYNNVTNDVLGNNAEAQIEGNNDKFFSPSFINLVNGKWDDGAGEYVSPRGNGAAYVQFNLISATSLDRIYFKGESLTSIIVYVQYEGDEEFTLAGICGSTTDIDNTPYVEADSTKKIVSVRFVEENPSIGGAKWQEIAFTKAFEEVIEDSNTGGAGGENETGGVSLWNIN